MPSQSRGGGPERQSTSRQQQEEHNGTPRQVIASGIPDAASAPPSGRDGRAYRAAKDVEGLKDYQLGDCLGKGAFGSVYRALNWETRETVAIKQVKLADLPKSELRVMMSEIDLLKNLNHPNIVKYHGFTKSDDSLYIILEYCENGSLHSLLKNFGKFPEGAVAFFMSQVLDGLVYLHDQGVIHRDIKGANILTTKEGHVKLADFGVATKAAGLDESSVVGTPYWMAPEVIELSGAGIASDIWSVGCTVIELIEGKPPYHKLQPMQALFRIVNDEHPPLPASASSALRSFLMECFQKNPNLRISARKLLKVPWISSARRANSSAPSKPTEYSQAVKSVQEWNERLKSSPSDGVQRRKPRSLSSSLGSSKNGEKSSTSEYYRKSPVYQPGKLELVVDRSRPNPDAFRSPEVETNDNWDDDFVSSINPMAFQLPQLRPHDNFAGLLSSEKLKAYATFEPVAEETSADDDFGDGDLTLRSPAKPTGVDMQEHEDVWQQSSGKTKTAPQPAQRTRRKSSLSRQNEPKTAILRSIPVAQGRRSSASRSSNAFRETSVEDYSDLIAADDAAFQRKLLAMQARTENSFSPKLFHPSDLMQTPRSTQRSKKGGSLRSRPASTDETSKRKMQRSQSAIEIQKYAEDATDADFSDLLGANAGRLSRPESDAGSETSSLAMITSKMSASWIVDDDEIDPFASLDENLEGMDLEHNVARDRDVRLYTQTEDLVSRFKTEQPHDVLLATSDQLLAILAESPDKKSVVLKSHGLLPILEILSTTTHITQSDLNLRLLKIVNMVILDNTEAQESICFIGGIPIITAFSHKKYPSDIRKEAAAFVRQMYQTSTLTLQMFIGCGGLNVLVDFLEEDLETERDLVLIGVNGMWNVFELQGPTPKNDFCRIFSRNSVLDPLSQVLSQVLDEEDDIARLVEERIVNLFLIFSQSEVKESAADRTVLRRIMRDLRRMRGNHQITMLKFIKNLSMLATTHEKLEASNAIETLTDLLRKSKAKPQYREISNQILNTMYNLCRLNKDRQKEAAENDIIPVLMNIVQTEWPLKEFALPILCDMAQVKPCRKYLWEQDGIQFYISLLADRYWQVTALDALHIWLQEETARVEQRLLEGTFTKAILTCFGETSTDAFENILEPLQKILYLSPVIAASLKTPEFFASANKKLHNANNIKKPFTRLNVLRVIRAICDATEEQGGLIKIHGLYDAIQGLANKDPSVLVREVAEQLINSADAHQATPARIRPPSGGRPNISTSMSTPPTPHKSKGTFSQPPTPRHLSREASGNSLVFDSSSTIGASVFDARPSISNSSISGLSRPLSSFRPASRDGNSGGSAGSQYSNASASSSSSIKSITPGQLQQGQQQSRLPRTRLNLARSKTENAVPSSSLTAMAETATNEEITPSTPTAAAPQRFVVKKRRETSASMSRSKNLIRERMQDEQRAAEKRGYS